MVNKNPKKQNKEIGFKELATMIDHLAIATANGFNRVEKRLDSVENKLDSVEDRLGTIEEKLVKIEKELYEIQIKIGSFEQRLLSIERTLGPLLQVSDIMRQNWKEHELRIERLEKKMGI